MTRFRWFGRDVQRRITKAERNALTDAAEYLLGESDKTVPHDEGTLQSSGTVSPVDPVNKSIAVSYGSGPSAAYAVRLHEHPEYRFQKGRRGKWLELTMKEQRGQIREIMAGRIRDGLKG